MTHPLSEVCKYPVVQGYELTPEFLAQTEIYYGVVYHRHRNGGGLVAESAHVPLSLFVPPTVRIGPNTRLLDDRNLAGRTMIEGDVSLDPGRLTPISRSFIEQDRVALKRIRLFAVISRTDCLAYASF